MEIRQFVAENTDDATIPIEFEALVPEIAALGCFDVGKCNIAGGKSLPIDVALTSTPMTSYQSRASAIGIF
jgi:hypothetical protein